MLAHKGSHEGKVAAECAHGLKRAFDARVIPSVAYTDPEVAWVGLTETDAKKNKVAYEKGTFPWAASGRALALGVDSGLNEAVVRSRYAQGNRHGRCGSSRGRPRRRGRTRY